MTRGKLLNRFGRVVDVVAVVSDEFDSESLIPIRLRIVSIPEFDEVELRKD